MKKALLILTLFLIDNYHMSYAVSLTSYRIYLDKNSRTESFIIFNRELQTEDCRLSFHDFPFDKASNMGKRITGTAPKTSASNLVRFSPKHFQIKAGSNQTVRFSLRRKANTPISEYHSYLSINCGKTTNDNTNTNIISLSPRLVHNIPVIARTGELSAAIKVSDLHINENGKLVFKLNRSGNRSVYGAIDIINRKSGKVINYLQGVSIYVQSDYREFDFSLPKGVDINSLSIRFKEDSRYGGSITINHDVKL